MLKLVKRKGSPLWYVRGTIKGQSIFESTRESSRIAADRYRLDLENKLHASVRTEKTFTEACLSYVQSGGEKQYIEKLDEALGDLLLSEVTQEIIDEKSRKTYPNIKDSTLRRRFYTPVCSVLNHAARMGWCPRPMIKKPKEKRPPPEWVEIDWLEKLWASSNDRVRALTTFLPYTGCRISECVDLTWDRVNLAEGWAYIPKTKTRAPRSVYLPKPVLDSLKRIKGTSGRVFGFKNRHTAIMAIRRACDKAGIAYKRPHVIGSHTYATWMRRYGGTDSLGLIGTGRWKDVRSVQRYAHVVPSEEAKKADLLPRAKNVQKKKKRAKT